MSIDREIAVSYLLGELPADERERFEDRLASDPDLERFVDGLRPVVGKLQDLPTEGWDPPEPPPLDFARATAPTDEPLEEREAQLDTELAERGSRRAGSPFWLRLAGFLATGAALLLIGFIIGSGTGGDDEVTSPAEPGPALALDRFGEAPESAAGEVRMVSSEGDQMRLDVAGLKPNPDGEFYELWLLGKEGNMIALGSFRVGEAGKRTVELPLPVDPASFQYFDVSIESDREGPEHSGRSVLRGLTTN